MTVDLSYQGALNGMLQDILRSEKVLESEQQEVMEDVGKVIKKKVVEILPKSNMTKADHTHMKSDVKITVAGKKKGTGVTGVSVHGGKKTAYKWHMLDDGTRNPDGSIHTPATHFTTKAMEDAESQINTIIDELQRRIAEA